MAISEYSILICKKRNETNKCTEIGSALHLFPDKLVRKWFLWINILLFWDWYTSIFYWKTKPINLNVSKFIDLSRFGIKCQSVFQKSIDPMFLLSHHLFYHHNPKCLWHARAWQRPIRQPSISDPAKLGTPYPANRKWIKPIFEINVTPRKKKICTNTLIVFTFASFSCPDV